MILYRHEAWYAKKYDKQDNASAITRGIGYEKRNIAISESEQKEWEWLLEISTELPVNPKESSTSNNYFFCQICNDAMVILLIYYNLKRIWLYIQIENSVRAKEEEMKGVKPHGKPWTQKPRTKHTLG